MKEEIESYEPKMPSVVAIGNRRVRAFVGDQQPRLGSTLWIGNVPTRIVSLAGGRRVEAIAFDTRGFAVGDAVRCADETAAWPSPRPGHTALDDLAFEPGRDASPKRPNAALTPLLTGVGVIDTLLPLAAGAVTLVLDCGAPDETVDRLIEALGGTMACASARIVPTATHQVLDSSGLGLAVAAHWALTLEDASLVIEAPPFDIDELLDVEARITTLVRVELRDGLEILAETLDLGHSDTQILLREDGTIDLSRSNSRLRAQTPLSERLARIAEIREQLQIFDEHELSEEDLAILEEANALEAGLLR